MALSSPEQWSQFIAIFHHASNGSHDGSHDLSYQCVIREMAKALGVLVTCDILNTIDQQCNDGCGQRSDGCGQLCSTVHQLLLDMSSVHREQR